MSLFRIARLCVPALALVLHAQDVHAQDAGMVLRTSVSYRTQRNSAQLTEEQRKEADRLAAEASKATQAGKYGDALRAYYQGMAVMRGQTWTPALEFASGLQGRLDHAVVDPGKQITVTLYPLYTATGTTAKLNGSVFLVPVKKDAGSERSLGSSLTVEQAKVPLSTKFTLPDGATGDYNLEVRLVPEGETAPPARAGFVKTLPVRVEPLAASVQRLRERLAKVAKKSPALPTAEYALELYARADRGEVNPSAIRFADEFARAHEILDAIEAGRDPFEKKRGDFRRAYRSPVDQTLQPYRLLIPEAYNATKPNPLVVALHGMGQDENSMFDAYGGGLKPQAERVGFVVAGPKGRDSASMYRGPAEQDVMDVIAEVRRDYNIDPNRIYLMGHSMGGYGTWSIAMAHPDVFAALGPVSGGGNPAGMAKIKHIPQYVVHGDNDATVPVAMSRVMVEAGKLAGAKIVYVELAGGNHINVVAPQFAPMLDFFAKQRKGATE